MCEWGAWAPECFVLCVRCCLVVRVQYWSTLTRAHTLSHTYAGKIINNGEVLRRCEAKGWYLSTLPPLLISDQAHGYTDLLRMYFRRLIKCQCEAEETQMFVIVVVLSFHSPRISIRPPPSLPSSSPKRENCAKTVRSLCTQCYTGIMIESRVSFLWKYRNYIMILIKSKESWLSYQKLWNMMWKRI